MLLTDIAWAARGDVGVGTGDPTPCVLKRGEGLLFLSSSA